MALRRLGQCGGMCGPLSDQEEQLREGGGSGVKAFFLQEKKQKCKTVEKLNDEY